MSYVPNRVPTDPEGIADSLSESLINPYGAWMVQGADISLDGLNVELPNYAVKIDSRSGVAEYYGLAIFEFTTPIDLSQLEKFQFDIAALNKGDPPNINGNGTVYLRDVNGKKAEATYVFPTDGTYVRRYFGKSVFTPDTGFDWTQVKRWEFLIVTVNVNPYTWPGYTVYLDAGPFSRQTLSPIRLAVRAKDSQGNFITGKSVQLASPQGLTQTFAVPFDFNIQPSGNWTITALETDFVQWQDGSTNPSITFTAVTGGSYELTATFTSGTPYQPTTPWIPILVTAGVIATSLIIYKLISGRRRPRS